MTELTVTHEVERFRVAIRDRLGLDFEDAKLGFLRDVLQRRLERLAISCDEYLRRLAGEQPQGEFGALAAELTVPETYFFRNNEQFRALAERVLPQRMRADRSSRMIRMLSAGCASGEEAYSLAIVARETITDPSWSVVVRAADLNPVALEKARVARYSAWALRTTPANVRDKWFREEGRSMTLADDARSGVTFELRNLVAADPDLWAPESYDVIFFRNVLMYFTPEHMRAAIARAARALMPGGFLFLGHAETLRGHSDEFHLRHTHETFYYERKNGVVSASQGESWSGRAVGPASVPASVAMAVDSGAWIDAIRVSSDRIAALVSGVAPARGTPVAPARPPLAPGWDMAGALDLLGKDRFADALARVKELPAESESDADVLLLKAALLTHTGDFADAEDACRRLLVIDELNAGAHHVLALCREHAGDRSAATDQNRIAAYLDPTFAMPRLHLGLLAQRNGDPDAARREFGQAISLLKHEDAARILLFGGGFTRASLLALCESALRECGARA